MSYAGLGAVSNRLRVSKPANSVCVPGLRRLFVGVAMLLSLGVLAACDETTIRGNRLDTPHVPLVAASNSQTGATVVTTREEVSSLERFLAPENLRETVFSGDTNPRLAGRQRNEPNGVLDLRRVNEGPDGLRQGQGEYYTDISGDEVFIEPLPRQTILGSQWQPPRGGLSGNIALNFNEAPLTQVIRDVMGGILGVNYIIGNNVEGSLSFRSERRFTQAEILQVMADILARNGYLMQYFNGIYHIGAPEELEALTGLRSQGGLAEDATDVIAMRRPPPENLVEVVNSLIPPGVSIAPIEGSNNLLVRGDRAQFRSVEDLVRSLIETRPGTQALAIIPVRRTPPEEIADQISQIYAGRGLGNILVVPVPTSPGILVVADTRATLTQIGELVRQLDVENRDAAQIRVIQLAHLDAQEMAERLSAIVGSEPLVPPRSGDTQTAEASNIIAAAIEGANTGEAARPASGSGLRAPRFIRGSDAAEDAGPVQGGAGGAVAAQGAGRGPVRGTGEPISFSADTRNNALLVRSNFVEFQRIQEVVRALDQPRAQVVIEATIIEVDINDQLQYGVQAYLQNRGLTLRSSNGAGGVADPGGSGGVAQLSYTNGALSVQAVLHALQSVTNVQVISSPYLTVVDGATSQLNVGDQIPFVIASQTSQSGGAVTVTQEIDTRDIGVILSVTPRISPNNQVLLDITQEVSSSRVAQTVAGQNPVIAQRRVQSQIVVQSGATVLLAGLIQERTDTGESGVPVLRRVPVVGNLFNRTSNSMSRTELLIMITPRVVRNADTLDVLTRQLRMAGTR